MKIFTPFIFLFWCETGMLLPNPEWFPSKMDDFIEILSHDLI